MRLRLELLFDSAPSGARPVYKYLPAPCHGYDLLGVACCDWSDPDCQVWVFICSQQVSRAAAAADAAEESAASAQSYYAAAATARRLVLAAANTNPDAAEQAIAAPSAAYDALVRACQAMFTAHNAALRAADEWRDVERATSEADDAAAAAAQAAEAARAAGAAAQAAKEAALDAGVDPDAMFAACGQAAASARERAERDFGALRQERMPRWRPTWYVASRFGGDPRRALREIAEEYLGVPA
jgi:hypothetical protein